MIYLDEPVITEQDIETVVRTLRSGHISTAHATVSIFEEACRNFLGVDDCVATNSGTSALHLALLACGAAPGIKVVVPALSFVATANAVKYTGAEIVFMDVDLDTWMIKNVVVDCDIILPVFLYGGVVNIGYVSWSANFENIRSSPKFVWDFAEAWGVRPFKSFEFGGDGYFCYSLNGNKTITAGGGGIICGPYMADTVRKWVHPRGCNGLAYNYRMPSLNAALAYSQLGLVIKYVNRKREIARIYKELLPEVKFQKGVEDGVVWMVAGLFPESFIRLFSEMSAIEWLQKELIKINIPTRRVFVPLNHYAHLKDGQFYPNAEYIYEHGLCLPSSVKNTDEDIEFVCKSIREICFG